jgi:hypothetical protein
MKMVTAGHPVEVDAEVVLNPVGAQRCLKRLRNAVAQIQNVN